MATNSDLKKQVDLLISSLERAGVNTDTFKRKLREAGQEEQKLVDLMNQLVSSLENADNSVTSLYETLSAISSELGSSNSALSTTKSLYGKITNDARKLRDDEQGITDLNKRQLQALQRRYKTNFAYLKEQKKGLYEEQAALKSRQKSSLALSKSERNRLAQYPAAIKMAEDQEDFVKGLEGSINNRFALEKQITKQMGVTGALVGGTGALMERLGMRSGIFHDAMEEANDEMRQMAKLTEDGEAKFSKLQIAAKGFGTVARGFGQALFDPATMIAAIVSKFFELNAASTKLQQLTGQNAGIQAAHNQSLASGAQVMEQMAHITKQTGISAAAIFTSEDLGRLAEAQNLLGLSAEEAMNLGMFSKVSGTNIQAYKEGLVESVNTFNEMNDSAVAHGVVIKDVLNASADITMSLGGSEKAITSAAAAARKLGLDLAKVNQIADGLMDFETSIGNELEAQLLTGKNINLNKARELALNNDLEGVAKELEKNGASAAEFANMNRIQQEAIAKAMGMNREEMGKMLINQKGMNNLTDDQRAKMRGVTLDQLEQMEAAESLKLAFSKIAEPIASILNVLSPFVTMLAKAVAFVAPIAPYLAAALTPLLAIYSTFKGIVAFSKAMLVLQSKGIVKSRIANRLGEMGLLRDKQVAFWKGRQTYFENLKKKDATKNLIIEKASLRTAIQKNIQLKYQTFLDKMSLLSAEMKAIWEQSSLTTNIRKGLVKLANNVKDRVSLGISVAKAAAEKSTLLSLVAQGFAMLKNIPKLVTQLGLMIAQAAAYAVVNPFAAIAGLVVGASIGAVVYSMTRGNDVMSPGAGSGYGSRTLMGPEGAIALNNKDTVIAGTDLFSGGEQQGASNSIGGVDLTPLVTEIRQMKAEVSTVLKQILNKEGTVTLDGSKVGSALVLGSYKSS
tara:strand:+ start:59 stop:2782 length:2724 start_codon:yes stop_codon:yes gene_type:complete